MMRLISSLLLLVALLATFLWLTVDAVGGLAGLAGTVAILFFALFLLSLFLKRGHPERL